MKRNLNLTVISLLLVAGALAIPSVSWYIVGRHDAEQRAVEEVNRPWRVARETAVQLAERVRTRLETLREAESRRPFYHYQSLYHDPKGAAEGAAVVPSPLAQGPTDPLIRAHFQIDASSKLTLPTLNEEALDAIEPQEIAIQRALAKELQPVVPSCLNWAQRVDPVPPQPQAQQQVAANTLRSKVEVLDSEAYQQNIEATRLYTDIKGGKGAKTVQRSTAEPKASSAKQKEDVVRVGVDDFLWRTISLNDRLTLFALRRVTTPQGPIVQGFVISTAAVQESLKGSAFPSRFRKQVTAEYGVESIPIADTGWRVTVDASVAVSTAQAAAEGIRERFIQTYLGSVMFAGIAGLCIVGLIRQMEKLARERSQFAASAAHELRTPLAGLRIYSEMLAEGLGDPARAKEYARRVAGEAERLGRVVANMLGFTRLERGTLKVHPEMGDLAGAVRECVGRQQAALEAAGAQIELSVEEGLPPARFDRDAVGEIIQNLLDNAEKHTRSAKDRTIYVALGQESSVNQNGSRLLLIVSDHGPGLPSEVRRNLFQPFTRGKNPDAPAGLGLGLVMVQALAGAQGAQVAYRDAPGGGAVFTVKFLA